MSSLTAAALTSQNVIQEVANNFEFDIQNALVELPCPHLAKHSGWKRNINNFIVTKYWLLFKAAQLWTEPICDRNSLKYRVFRDLWGRGKFVTCGDAFGADFLIYPGDPLLYHASHIVIIQSKPAIRPLELISKVRLSVIVNKSCVFAYEAADGKKIIYQTVAWCNPSK